MKRLVYIVLSLLLVCVLVGCKTLEQQSTKAENRIEYRDKYHRDSIYIRDSVIIQVKGDTVFKDRWRIEWNEKETGDTIILTDTVYIEKEVFREKSEPPNNNGLIIMLILIIIIIYKFK